MASTPEGSIGNPPSGSATPVSSIPQTTAVKEQPTSAAPLSASANAFNPGGGTNNQELLSPSAVLWGISRTTSTAAGAPTSSSSNSNVNVDASNNTTGSSGSAPGSNAGTPSKSNADASSSSATAASGGASGGGASESLGGLWNFGGFDVDALTNKNNHTHHPSNHHPQPSGGHHPHNMGGRNGSNINQGDVSGLSSAFGNFGLQQGSSSATTNSGMNTTYGGGSDYGGNKYGAPQAGKYTTIRKLGEKAGKETKDILQYMCCILFDLIYRLRC